MTAYDVPYMERTRKYYRAQGYSSDYLWPHHDEVPFTALRKALTKSRVGVITTAMPNTPTGRAQRQVYANRSQPIPGSMYTDELSWHKSMTHTRDVASFLPLQQLQAVQSEGLVGDIAARFYSAPTEYSQCNTTEKDAPEILDLCRQDEVDVVILVPL